MKKIYKYEIHPQMGGYFSLELPVSVELVHTSVDNKTGIPCMWFEFNSEDEHDTDIRKFKLIPTGVEFDSTNLSYVDTYLYGPFVWHIYELLDSE